MAEFDTDAFEDFLKDISEPFITEDIATWAARIRLPFSMVTQSGPATLETFQHVEKNFELYLKAKKILGLEMVVREPIGFEVCPDGTVIATYRTNLLRTNGTRVQAPYTSSALLHFENETWRMSAIMNALGHHRWTDTHPLKERGER